MCGRTDTAIVTDLGYLYSYNELENQSERFASYIDNRSVVAFLTSNSIECIVGYMGCLNNKIVPILLSESIHYEQLKIILDDYKPSYIWIPEKCKDNFINYQQIYRMNNYVLFKLNNLRVELNDKLALLLSTSGSTGSSKLVRISYENIQTNTKSIIKSLDIKKGDRAITVLPFNYTYGLSVINTHLYMGATILLTNIPVYKKEFWDFFSKYGGTSFSGVPYTYEMLIKLRLLNKFPTSVRAITQAGGSLDIIYQKEISEYAVEKNIEFYVMYGQTEATSYDMTGGIYTKKTFDVDTKMKISISPDIGRSDCNMSIYTYTEHWYGKTRDNCIADVSSISSSTTVSTYTGKYGIYLRNWSGFQWTGDLTINYK